MLPKCLTRNFACEIHISYRINLTNQFSTRTLTFFFVYPYTHVGNMLLIDYIPYKNMFNGSYSAIFWTPLMAIMGKISICWGLFSLTWKTFIHPDTMFPPLLNKIPLVRLDVLIEIIQDFLKCNQNYQPNFCNNAKLKLKQKSTLTIVHPQILLV